MNKQLNMFDGTKYDKGFTRIGCIGCPMAGKHRQEEFNAYPKYKALYKKLADDIEKISLNGFRKEINGKTYPTLFDWWINV